MRVTVEDATIDLLCYQHLMSALRDRKAAGAIKGFVEATLAANPGLASAGILLPLGSRVVLPDFVVASGQQQTQRLWDE